MNMPDDSLLEIAWYLSTYGAKKPPITLGVRTWKDAAALFYPRFGTGKTSLEFYNSLKNHRDRFDSWMSDTRTGWRNKDGTPRKLPALSERVMQRMKKLPKSVIEEHIISLLTLNPTEKIDKDIHLIQNDKNLDETTKQRLISARLGQGDFRKKCLKIYSSCPVTGIDFEPLLRASHIKPWSACQSGKERLDPYNGIILSANIDILFDQGWISFYDDGEVLFSKELDTSLINKLNIPKKINKFTKHSFEYLTWHRDNVFKVIKNTSLI